MFVAGRIPWGRHEKGRERKKRRRSTAAKCYSTTSLLEGKTGEEGIKGSVTLKAKRLGKGSLWNEKPTLSSARNK